MKIREAYPSVVEATELPRIIRLGDNLYGASFFLMKLLPAHFILDRAREEGLVEAESVVIETSSGTFGLALALLCNQRGYRLILVSDPAIEPPLQRRLEDLGAVVDIVRNPAPVGGFQKARLVRMAQLQSENPGAFWPSQYDNPANPGSYASLAELLAETLGRVDYLVCTVGSGGSACGTTSYLRPLFPEMKSVSVDTLGSVLFGQPDEGQRLLRGLGNSLMPKNLNHSLIDEVHWVTAAGAFAATRVLHQQHGLYMGPTSGAAYLVAQWRAHLKPEATVVALLPDEGYRYQDTVYDDEWLRAQNVWQPGLSTEPRQVNHPLEAGPQWSWMHWNRRSYEQVMNAPFQPE